MLLGRLEILCVAMIQRGTGADANEVTGCAGVYAAVEDIRRYGAHIDLWRSSGVIWVRTFMASALGTSHTHADFATD